MNRFWSGVFCICIIILLDSINTKLKHLLDEIKKKPPKTIMDVLQQERTGELSKIYGFNQENYRGGRHG